MELDDLVAYCRACKVPLIEDAAQAFGARVGGRHAGTIGDAGIYSFGLYKNVNALYGGMVVTRDKGLYERLAAEVAALPPQKLWPLAQRAVYALQTELLTWPPVFSSFTYHIFRYAYLNDVESLNRRVREENNPKRKDALPPGALRRPRAVQARLALDRLGRVDDDTQIRLGFAQMYHEGLTGLDSLRLPPWRDDGSHVYIQYPVQCADRKSLVKHMMRAGCDVACQHMRNCADISCFAEYYRDCPHARATAEETVVLPTYPKYGREDVERNIRAIRSYFAASTTGASARRGTAAAVPEPAETAR
jgi:dTDP-4-amino-4,6-dideoxygalactose transaminase